MAISEGGEESENIEGGVMATEGKQMDLMTCINSILDNLQFRVIQVDSRKDDHGLNKLKMELKLVKTFILCCWQLGNSWSSLEDSVLEYGLQFYSLLDEGLPAVDLAGSVSAFREILKNFSQPIGESYVELLDMLLQSGGPPGDEFMIFLDSLQDNLVDILLWGRDCDSALEELLNPLHKKLVFLRDFVIFVGSHRKPNQKLMDHYGVVGLSAARICCICWFFRDDDKVFDKMQSEISDTIEKINPVNDQTRLAYIEVLSYITSIRLSSTTEASILWNFVHSLVRNLTELILNSRAWFTVSVKHQMQILYEGLRFLRIILKKQSEKYEVLHNCGVLSGLGGIVCDAGVVIFSLYQNQIQEASFKAIEVKLSSLLTKIMSYRALIERKIAVPLRFNFTTTNEPGLIDVILKKVKELASCKVDSIPFAERADLLRSLPHSCIVHEGDICMDGRGFHKLKVELRLVKTFLLCPMELTHSQYSLKFSVYEKTRQFYSLLVRSEDDGLPPSNLAAAASNFLETLKDFRQRINELYVNMSNSLLRSVSLCRIQRNLRGFVPGDICWYEWGRKLYPSMLDRLLESSLTSGDEFMEFFQSLLENLGDILIWGEACDSKLEKLFEPLHEKLLFLRNFILFARLQCKHECELMQHCGLLALSAAHLCYIGWFFRDDNQLFDGMQVQILESVEKIKPIDQQVRLAYIHVLESGSSSFYLSSKTDMFMVGDFVDSLLGNLWELLLNCPTNFLVSLKHQMRMLYEGLQYLRNILKTQPEKCDGLPERFNDLIGSVVNDAGIVIFSLYQNNIPEALTEEIDVKLFCLIERIKVIQAEVEKNHPAGVRFNNTTNVLGTIDLLLEKLKELARCKVDIVYSFAKDRADFLRSYLKNNMEHPTRYLKVCSQSGENDSEQHNQDRKLQPQRMQEDLLFLRSFLENNLEQHIEDEQLQLQRMQDGLLFLSSFLAKNREQCNHHEEFQTFRSRVMEVAYKADFVIDSLMVGDISFYALMLFDNITSEIKLLKAKTSEISGNENVIEAQQPTKHLRNVPSQETSTLTGASHQVPSQASISTINEAVVGLKDEEQAIIDQLIGGSMQLDIISIVGMPGLGKTFLAQRVYRHPSVTSHFYILAWCCISQTYCKKDLLLEMLSCIEPKAQYSEMSGDDLAHKLCNHLRKQKYLIVLDDIWDIEAWNALKISFPDHTNGSRILLTSRHHGIIGKPHYLRPLDEEESWELLQKRLSITTEAGFSPELNVLSKQIAKHCNGLPLSIVIISGILLTLDEVGWEEIAERLNSNKMIGATEQCKSILELSYIHLPDHLKPCLTYFGAFSEDQEISVRRLILLWIAEGFVKKSGSENLEKIAEGYIMALISRSLVMVGQQRSVGGIKTCRIHDLLHVFCLEKARNQNFLHFMRGYDVLHKVEEPYDLCRLSIYSQPKHFVKSRLFCPHLRSLLHSSRGVGSREVLDHLAFIFLLKLLRVLDLGQISLGSAFPTELSLLVELRYLAVLGWFKDGIPSSLEKLSNLETFFVTTCYSDVDLSLFLDTLLKMQKLRHLHVRGALIDLRLANDKIDCSIILYNLDTFSNVKLYLGQSMEKAMGKFPNVRELKCFLQQSEESSNDSNMIVAMDFLSQLESLKLVLCKVASHHIEFHFPLNLRKLTVEDFSRRTISTIAKLPNLQVLKLLRQADGAKEWDMEGEDEGEFFPELKFLKLEDLSIVRWRG